MAEGLVRDEHSYWLPQVTLDGGLYLLNTLTSGTTTGIAPPGSSTGPKVFEEFGCVGRVTSATKRHTDEEVDAAQFWILQTTPEGEMFFFNCLTGDTTSEPPSARFAHLEGVENKPESEPESGADVDVEEVQEILKVAMPAPLVFPPEWRLQATLDGRLFYYDAVSGNVTFGVSFSKPVLRTIPRDLDFELALRMDLEHDRDDPRSRIYVLDEVSRSWDRLSMSDGSVYCYNTKTNIMSRPYLQRLVLAKDFPRARS